MTKVLVTGGTGFLGRYVVARLQAQPDLHVILAPGRHEADLREMGTFFATLKATRPTVVVHLAYPGTDGIGTSMRLPGDLARDVLMIDINVIEGCAHYGDVKLICTGSVCSYPETVEYPTSEDWLLSGPPESVNAPYGQAKRMQLALMEAYQRQNKLRFTQLVLSNLYGPGDKSGHVIPATIRKVAKAVAERLPEVDVWGSGTATREFLFVEDAAEAVLRAVRTPALCCPVNICSGEEISIRELVTVIMEELDYWGAVHWDTSKPDGQPRRQFDNRRAAALLGWKPQVPFKYGIAATIRALAAQGTLS